MRKRRILAAMLVMVMGCRYSEMSMLFSQAQAGVVQTGEEEASCVTMISKDIGLYYRDLLQGGLHEEELPEELEEAVRGMFYDRADFADYYQSFGIESSFTQDIYSASNVQLSSPQIQVSAMLGARLDQHFCADEFVLEENGILYAAQGDITIDATDVDIKGVIYAPHGCVTVHASDTRLSGLILAESIRIFSDTIREEPVRNLKELYSGLRMDFCPELLVTGEADGTVTVYAGNLNIRKMGIYVRENDAGQFQKIAEAEGNEYCLALGSDVQTADIRMLCTNSLGQEAFSDIVTVQRKVQEDGTEVFETGSVDTDGDGLPDGYEIWDTGTNPLVADSDGDGLPDGYEILTAHTDPLVSDGDLDLDGDGKTTWEEYQSGTHPLYADTDFDGLSDGEEEEPLRTAVLADQSEYQGNIPEPEEGFFDRKRIFVDATGNRQVQMFNLVTKEEYYDVDGEEVFLRVTSEEGIETTLNGNADETTIETTVTGEDGRILEWAVDGNVYRYEEEGENIIATYLNDRFVSTSVYDADGNVMEKRYANGTVMEYDYDANGNVTSIGADGEERYHYEYGEDTITVTDRQTDTVRILSVDEANGSIAYQDTDGWSVQTNIYRGENNTEREEILNMEGMERITTYAFTGDETGREVSVVYPDGLQMTETEDAEERVESYLDGQFFWEKKYEEDGQLAEWKTTQGTYAAKRDANGFPTQITKDGTLIGQYQYDANGQLSEYRDLEAGKIYRYEYDTNYHLKYALETDFNGTVLSEESYEYQTDATEGLQGYSGEGMVYDASGNPVIYRDRMQMSWLYGRMLERIQTDTEDIRYEYNSDGVRTAKTVGTQRTEYFRDAEGKLLGEETDGDCLWYLYDGNGTVIGFEWEGNSYLYVRNILGEIEGIADTNGVVLCTYHYDAWGKLTGMTGDTRLAEKNSICYKSYEYDRESGFYYLKTRYYDPEVKQFLNRDCLENESNLYQYCYNNPVHYSDESGMSISDCDDVNVKTISNPYGSVYSYYQNEVVFYLNNNKIYFNCYMWAIGIYAVNYKTYNNPGYKSNQIWSTVDSVSGLAQLSMSDLRKCGYSVISCTTYIPTSITSDKKVIAVRMNNNKSDYHFMKQTYSNAGCWWSFKAGQGGPVFQLINGKKPNQITWNTYKYNVTYQKWCMTGNTYTSTIYYISYK